MTRQTVTVAPDRRAFLQGTAAGIAGLALAGAGAPAADKDKPAEKGKPTKFQIACMTLPYARFPLERALSGIRDAGYRHVAWGTNHLDGEGKRVAVLAGDAAPDKARELGKKCRDLGLEPVLMFGPGPEDVEVLKRRVLQASAAGVAQVLTMGTTKGNDRKTWVKNLK